MDWLELALPAISSVIVSLGTPRLRKVLIAVFRGGQRDDTKKIIRHSMTFTGGSMTEGSPKSSQGAGDRHV
jgi:hypothetical protein